MKPLTDSRLYGILDLGYVPLGTLLAMTLARLRGAGWRTWAATAVAASLLSYVLEVGQGLLPQRVPSLLDWMLNSAGAMAGAGIGLWLEGAGSWRWLQRTGEHWFAQHSRTGFALLLLWPLVSKLVPRVRRPLPG